MRPSACAQWPPNATPMATLVRDTDWSATVLGPVDTWSTGLRIAVTTVLDSPLPTIVLWGPKLIQIYNDAYRPILASRHPLALGQPTRACWPEVWHFNEPIYRKVQNGEPVYVEDQSYEIAPTGVPRTHYFSVSYAPARDESGAIGGVLVTVIEATERVLAARAQAALLTSTMLEAQRLQRLFDQAPGWLTVLRGKAHVYEMANEAYYRLFGQRDIIGKSVVEVFPESMEQGIIAMLDRVFDSGVAYQAGDTRFRLVSQRGGKPTEVYLDMVCKPLAGPAGDIVGILAMGQDVTERHFAQARLQAFSDSVPALTWITDANGWAEHFNAQWHEYTGQAQDAALGEGWVQALHPDDQAPSLKAWNHSVATGGRYEIEHRLRGRDGADRWFLTRAVPQLDKGGEVLCWFGTSTDIDSVKQLEATLEDADRRKDQFVATLAHELRGPLAPIRSAVQALESTAIAPAEALQLHAIIKRQTKTMALLLDDLLDVSRVTRGQIALRLERVSLQSVLDAALETAQPLIAAKRHRLEVQLDAPSLELQVDPLRLSQVLANLLTNAAKYTDPGGSIVLSAKVGAGSVCFSVRDTGIGLATQSLTSVFTLFSQERARVDRSEGGLGIGLALVKALVELHGGSVEALSAGVGAGCEFKVRLPLDGLPAARRGLPDSAAASASASPAQIGRKVLVAEDNPDSASTLAVLLRLEGHEVIVAHNGLEAMRLGNLHCPEIMLLDIGMPALDGYAVAKQLRRQAWAAKVTLIALTGWGQAEDRRRATEAGFDHHFHKPVDPELLLRFIAGMPPWQYASAR